MSASAGGTYELQRKGDWAEFLKPFGVPGSCRTEVAKEKRAQWNHSVQTCLNAWGCQCIQAKRRCSKRWGWRERQKSTTGGLVTKSKLILLTTRQASTLRGELLGQRIATLFGKPQTKMVDYGTKEPSCLDLDANFLYRTKRRRWAGKVKKAMCELSCIRLFATPWTIACQAPLSMGFSSQGDWSGLSFPPPGIFLTQRLNPSFLGLLHWQADSLLLSHLGSPPERW